MIELMNNIADNRIKARCIRIFYSLKEPRGSVVIKQTDFCLKK